MQHQFDELAKDLARGLSRREALRRLSGGLAGALLAALGLEKAWGQGNSACAHFCNQIFPPGPERGHCKSDAAHGQGLCFGCGAAAAPGHPEVCAAAGLDPFCCPDTARNCCAGTGGCVDTTSDPNNCGACGNLCGAGLVCGNGECVGCKTDKDCKNPSKPNCCSGQCVDKTSDQNNCGACGRQCSRFEACRNGQCELTCGGLCDGFFPPGTAQHSQCLHACFLCGGDVTRVCPFFAGPSDQFVCCACPCLGFPPDRACFCHFFT